MLLDYFIDLGFLPDLELNSHPVTQPNKRIIINDKYVFLPSKQSPKYIQGMEDFQFSDTDKEKLFTNLLALCSYLLVKLLNPRKIYRLHGKNRHCYWTSLGVDFCLLFLSFLALCLF